MDNKNNKKKPNKFLGLLAGVILAAAAIFSNEYFGEADHNVGANSPSTSTQVAAQQEQTYQFRREDYLTEHFEKHGAEFGYKTKEEYLEGANQVIASDKSLHKLEEEDGDDVYFLESTGGFVIVSTDGYIRTYFRPNDGIAYFNRQ